MVILDPNDRPVCSEDFDNLFQATIPDKDKEPLLFSLVSDHHVHDCEKGNCIDEDGNCRFHYRFENCDETSLFSSQRVKWKRPNNGNVIKKYCYKKKKFIYYDNRDIVPYNPALLLRYKCHIFFDICTTKLAAVRYLFSYVFKGEDYASVVIRRNKALENKIISEDNEIELLLNGRIIGSEEAFWKLMEFPIIEMSPPTEILPIHLPGKNFINTDRDMSLENVQKSQKTKLTAFFKLNKKRLLDSLYMNFPDDLYYNKISKYYV